MADDRDTLTIWPGKDGWDLIDDLDEVAEKRDDSRNQLILDAISLYLGVETHLRDSDAWANANSSERRIMLSNALRDYRDGWE